MRAPCLQGALDAPKKFPPSKIKGESSKKGSRKGITPQVGNSHPDRDRREGAINKSS